MLAGWPLASTLSIGTADGKRAFGLALVKYSFALRAAGAS